jgi:hypothetical protein
MGIRGDQVKFIGTHRKYVSITAFEMRRVPFHLVSIDQHQNGTFSACKKDTLRQKKRPGAWNMYFDTVEKSLNLILAAAS